MEILKAFCIAFSIYSKIPVPQFKWDEKDMRYHLIFFPCVGALIGGLIYLWNYICISAGIGQLTYTCVGVVIPLIVTGGFHVDGFMDTMDALKSYKSREDKLKIMKDAHVGAFAVIMLAAWGLIYMGAFSYIGVEPYYMLEVYGAFVCVFTLSRILSAILVLSLKGAKDDGMLHTFSDSASSRRGFVKCVLYIELIICIGYMLWSNVYLGMALIVTAAIFTMYYVWKTRKEFGGVTGDTAGWFVVCLEILLTVVAAAYAFMIYMMPVGIG